MNPLSEDIKTLLEAEADLDLTFAENLFIGMLEKSPDNQVAIIDVPGRGPLAAYSQDVIYNYPVVDIIVRNVDYIVAWRLGRDIANALNNRSHLTVGGTSYQALACISGLHLYDWDESNRVRFIMSFEGQRR